MGSLGPSRLVARQIPQLPARRIEERQATPDNRSRRGRNHSNSLSGGVDHWSSGRYTAEKSVASPPRKSPTSMGIRTIMRSGSRVSASSDRILVKQTRHDLCAILPICRSIKSARLCASQHFATIRSQSRAEASGEGTVLWVDEAVFLSVRQMLDLQEFAVDHNCR
jgi:hypothetical protein